jgi:small conductance mechanosensitive channel
MLDRVVEVLTEVTPQNAWDWFKDEPLKIVVTIAAALVLRFLLIRSIGRVVRVTLARADARRSQEPGRARRALASASGIVHERHRQRTLTMGSLLRSTVTFVIALITILTVMGIVHINLAPALATAGVGGVALGFGAQSLVKDFLSGIFMILEDQYGVGDVIDTGEAVGTVEEVSLRVTRLRDGQGVVWYIRNGEIVRIGNKSQGWAMAVVDMPIGFAGVDEATAVLRQAAASLAEDPEYAADFIEPPEVLGVEQITVDGAVVRTTAKTPAEAQFRVVRELRRRLAEALEASGLAAKIAASRMYPRPSAPPNGETGQGGAT